MGITYGRAAGFTRTLAGALFLACLLIGCGGGGGGSEGDDTEGTGDRAGVSVDLTPTSLSFVDGDGDRWTYERSGGSDIVGTWFLADLEGAPGPVDGSNSTLVFRPDATYSWFFQYGDDFDLAGDGSYTLSGDILLLDGVLAEVFGPSSPGGDGGGTCEVVTDPDASCFLRVTNDSGSTVEVDFLDWPLGAEVLDGRCELYGLLPGTYGLDVTDASTGETVRVDFSVADGQTYSLVIGPTFFGAGGEVPGGTEGGGSGGGGGTGGGDPGSPGTGDPGSGGGSGSGGSSLGGPKWSFPTGGNIGGSSPAVAEDGTVYVAADDAYGGTFFKLFALRPDGIRKWEYTVGGTVRDNTPAVGDDGTVYLGTSEKRVYAIRPTGVAKWVFATVDVVYSAPAIGPEGTIYVGTGNPYVGTKQGSLYALNPDGTEKWRVGSPATASGWSSPAVGADGTVYAAAYDGRLHALRPDGTEKWSTAIDGWWGQPPSLGGDGTVYVGSNSGTVHAVSANGAQKWVFRTSDAIGGAPAVGPEGVVYVPSRDGKLYALRPDGSLKWSAPVPLGTTPALGADGTGYLGSWADNTIRALDLATGQEKGSYLTLGPIGGSPAIAPDGTVYLGSWDGRLYAIEGAPGGLADSAWPMAGHDARRTGRASGLGPTGGAVTRIDLAAAPSDYREIALAWNPDPDTSAAYVLYRDGAYLGTASAIAAVDANVAPSSRHCYVVAATDGAGNERARSNEACATAIADAETANYFLGIEGVSLNGRGTEVTVAAGGAVSVFGRYAAWSRIGCPGCIDWISVGVEQDAQAAYDLGIPGSYPGADGSFLASLVAPSQPGRYRVFALLCADYTAPDALSRYETGTSIYPVCADAASSWGAACFVPVGVVVVR